MLILPKFFTRRFTTLYNGNINVKSKCRCPCHDAVVGFDMAAAQDVEAVVVGIYAIRLPEVFPAKLRGSAND